MKLEIGQKVYISRPQIYGKDSSVGIFEITKIGRKYAYYNNRDDNKIEIATMKTPRDYRGIEYDVFESKEAYEQFTREHQFIAKVRQRLSDVSIRGMDYCTAVKLNELLDSVEQLNSKQINQKVKIDE